MRSRCWCVIAFVGLVGFAAGCGGGDSASVDARPSDGVPDADLRECRSNPDCAAPLAVCDTVAGRCVECLALADCAHKPDTVCSLGECTCAGAESYCEDVGCVAFDSDPAHCGRCNHACFGACADGACNSPWEPVSAVGAPTARARHVAVWTGSKLIIWGGATTTASDSTLATGGVYDPTSSRWTPTSTVGAPRARAHASAVWTGSEMIVWGGLDDGTYLNDGALYDPATDTWRSMSTVGAPTARLFHTAVWTGSEMIVWGGSDNSGEQLATGGRYDPTANTWTAMPAAAESRALHTAIWTGSEMWVYGGIGDVDVNLDIYLPGAGAPGGRAYDPESGWRALPVVAQPSARAQHSAVWTGDAMMLFGGTNGGAELATGARLQGDSWTALAGALIDARYRHTATWVADRGVMVVWGGRDTATGVLASGGVYDPNTDTWLTAPPLVLGGRYHHTAVSTGDGVIIWGGFDGSDAALGDGAIYFP